MKHRWYKGPGKNPYNGRIIPIPYADDEFHIEPCDMRIADELLAIYRPYVERTAVSFELEPPSLDAFCDRMLFHLKTPYPWLVACLGDRPIGYAYSAPFHPRAAYHRSVELSIYLAPDAHRQGYGRQLYTALLSELRTRGFANAYACLAYSTPDDPYLTRASVDFHTALGFHQVGLFTDCAEKFGHLYSMIWMERPL